MLTQEVLMGAECMSTHIKDEADEIPSVPPGFVSVKSFTLQKASSDVLPSVHASDSLQGPAGLQSNVISDGFKKSLRRRPWINYRQFDSSSEEEECDSDSFEQDYSPIHCLPKGVIRGCAECANCQKVTARLRPADARRPILDEAPVFYPNEEEFKDTLKYIATIRPRAEPYGICRIVPPSSWRPPCPLKEKGTWEHSKFATRIQQVDKLQNRCSVKTLCRTRRMMTRKRRRRLTTGTEYRNSSGNTSEHGCHSSAERFGFEPGPDFTLESFQKYADDFKEQYFRPEGMDRNLHSGKWEASVDNIEGEYWRIVEKPTEEIEVLYGADLETGVFGSGFPKASAAPLDSNSEDPYVKSGWNLNNLPRLPGSVLSFESTDISGVLVPWLYVGMCFSSFCWHVEDHHLYSMNYLHWGAPKVWYGVPGKDAPKLEEAMKKHLAELFEEQPDLLHNLVTQFSPSMLKSEAVPVYRCVQRPGEFVVTFPRAYHSGFNCGFNCAEAVNVAPVDWLPHGQNAIELYREQLRKISISHDKLLLGAAREAVRAQWNISFFGKSSVESLIWRDSCGPNGTLAKALKSRIELERSRREYLSCSSRSRKMDENFDANSERECVICHYDLHLSAAGCPCSPDRFACLSHAKQLCSCSWDTRFFIFRYDIGELNVLVDALGGKLSAVHRWGLSDLGLSLSSRVTKDKPQESKPLSATSKEETLQRVRGPLNQDSPTDYTKRYGLSQESKGLSQEKSSLEKSREREKKDYDMVNSTFNTVVPLPLQQTNLTTASLPTEPQVQSLSIGSQSSIPFEGQISSYFKLSGSSDNKSSQQGNLNSGSFQVTSSEQNSMSCPPLARAKHLTSVSSLLSNGNTSLSATDSCVVPTSNAVLERARKSSLDKVQGVPLMDKSEALTRLRSYDDKVTSCNSQKEQALVSPEINMSIISEKDIQLLPVMEKSDNIPDPILIQTTVEACQMDGMHEVSHGKKSVGVASEKQMLNLLASEEDDDYSMRSNENNLQHPQPPVNVKTNDGKIGPSGLDSVHNLVNKSELITESSSGPSSSLDKTNRLQKGPRMAKVVRRINCSVEPLENGVVLSGKLWSTSQAIYPKGYRSRVKYFSILDPAQMCPYISEILDAGLLGPLFMVKVEQCPSEVFFHVSPTKCWDMVRERVNQEIRRHHGLGRVNLPSLQPPGSLDGLEMFGLSSPTIVQALEAADRNHICSEYWKSRTQTPCSSIIVSSDKKAEPDDPDLLSGTDVELRGLFRKANPEELNALHCTLSDDRPRSKQRVIDLISQELEKRL